jgi:CHAT domain-containing protein
MSGKLHRIKDIQNKLGTKESIIEYFLTDSVLYSFCLTSDEYELNREVITGTFFGDIEKVLNFVKYPTITASDSLICLNYRNASYNLYTKLILPFLPIIKDKSLIIVPDGRLTYLPFSTLLTCSTLGESLNYKELPYLLKQYPIRYVYASGLINTMNNNHAKKLMLAFAPSYENSEGKLYLGLNSLRDGDLNYLNFNKKEVETAANYIGGSVLYSKGASEETFKKKAGDYRIVHLAMHATANDDDPVNSRLYFTPNSSTSDDDFLYSYETYNLKLNTDLLVLSACNSGTGKLQKGEGILSLTRGFVFAGVKSIIMTLWAVDDKAAYSINERFYKNITRKLPKDEALQKSSLEYIQTSDIIHAHPYYWAGYVLIGDNSAIDCFRIRLGYMLAFILFVVIASVSFIYYTSYKQKLKKQRLG